MKFAIAKEHKDFFQKQGHVEFENFFNQTQIEQYNLAIDRVLSERLKSDPAKFARLPTAELFLKGHDLWREHEVLQKLCCNPLIAEIAAELIEQRNLRLGYDQLLLGPTQTSITQQTDAYISFIQKEATLEEISCLHGLLCGILISLSPNSQSTEKSDFLPEKQGNILFFQPNIKMDLKALHNHPTQRYYLIVFTSIFASYYHQPNDPHTPALKSMGFIYNDKLTDKTHPIIHR